VNVEHDSLELFFGDGEEPPACEVPVHGAQ
jgi:hypothetical protein